MSKYHENTKCYKKQGMGLKIRTIFYENDRVFKIIIKKWINKYYIVYIIEENSILSGAIAWTLSI